MCDIFQMKTKLPDILFSMKHASSHSPRAHQNQQHHKEGDKDQLEAEEGDQNEDGSYWKYFMVAICSKSLQPYTNNDNFIPFYVIMVSVMDESDYFDGGNDEEGYSVATPQGLEEVLENLTTVFFLLYISFISKIMQNSPHLPQFSPRLGFWVKWRI